MSANRETVQQQIKDLKNYTDTLAAIYLFKEVAAGGAVVNVGTAQVIIAEENSKKDPNIGNVVKEILAAAGQPGKNSVWKIEDDKKWHFEAVITIGGAVYNVNFTQGNIDNEGTQEYIVNINSKLNQKVSRGKLFFDNGHSATVKLTYDKEGDLQAVTDKGLTVTSTSFKLRNFQNEILAKFYKSLEAGKKQRLAVMGTGSGKSYVMAGIGQAIGRTVIIVPDKTLVDQQAKDMQIMIGEGVINKVKVKEIKIFTMESFKNIIDFSERDHPELATDKEKEEIKKHFKNVISGQEYDQIILQAEHPWFKLIVDEIKDSMVLIDESHRHTFAEEDRQVLQELTKRNTILALTATPTSKLYELFPGDPLDDLNLGSIIELGQARPIKSEVDYLAEAELVDQAVLHYFDDYYLEKGMDGYIEPVKLKEQIKKDNPSIEDSQAEKQAIDQALAMNRIRAQRNMAFSDDKSTREKLAAIYQNIANGDQDTLDKYQEQIAFRRQESEILARVELAKKFPGNKVDKVTIGQQVPRPLVDLRKDIEAEQQKDIQRTINSHALALVFNEKAPDIAKKDRAHKLEDYLKEWDKDIEKFATDSSVMPAMRLSNLKENIGKSREQLKQLLEKMGEPISKLATEQKDAIVKLVLDRAQQMCVNINSGKPISDIVTKADPVDLVAFKARESYASTMDVKVNSKVKAEQLAQMGVGLRTHIVADQVIATGVSIKDVLNVQIINNYSPVIESNINAINEVLSLSQAAGRCVRETDVFARAQQLIDSRYENKGLILTIPDIIDPKKSAEKTRVVMLKRSEQAEKERKAAICIQSLVRRYNATMFACQSLSNNVEQLKQDMKTTEARLADIEKSLKIKVALLEVHDELAIVSGGNVKFGQLPTEYTRNPFLYSLSVKEKVLLIKNKENTTSEEEVNKKVIKNEIVRLRKEEFQLKQTVKNGQKLLKKLQAKEEKLEQELGIRSNNPR
jgi:superfamily II DNA or RNA helicase